jgi:ParB-like chromosome segregation protein Spo0J
MATPSEKLAQSLEALAKLQTADGAVAIRARDIVEAATVPVRIVNLTDAEALEAQLIENLQRRDVHPLEEAQGFRALLALDEPKYSIEQIAAKVRAREPECLISSFMICAEQRYAICVAPGYPRWFA